MPSDWGVRELTVDATFHVVVTESGKLRGDLVVKPLQDCHVVEGEILFPCISQGVQSLPTPEKGGTI